MAYLSKDGSNLEHVQFLAQKLPVFSLVDTVRHDYHIQRTSFDSFNGISTKNAMRHERIYFSRVLLLQQFGCTSDRVARIGQVVDQNRGAIRNITHEHHGCILAVRDLSWAALLHGISFGIEPQLHAQTLWINANGIPKASAIAVARFAPPASGLTMTACW